MEDCKIIYSDEWDDSKTEEKKEGAPCVVIFAEYTKDGELNMFKINKFHDLNEYTLEEFLMEQLEEFKTDREKDFQLDDDTDLDDLGFIYECEVVYLNPI